MEIPSNLDLKHIEDKWYNYWMEAGFFASIPDEREPYTVVIPPPNVTGILHMGHMLNNTIQDVLVRRARMLGKNACWVPGTDHASIATEAKVISRLKERGIKKEDLTREEFLKHAWEWKEEYGGAILEQLKKLGASCDWSRTSFTMDEVRSKSVIKAFIQLFNEGLIYRGVRMVNWDPEAKTAISDEEVQHTEEQSKLYYLKYLIEGDESKALTIATTRPETILGDTAVCVNPEDERFKHLVGKNVIVPLAGRSVPIIEDEYVDIDFGTGCLKITPAHDVNDQAIGLRHNLPSIDIFNDDGTLNENGLKYEGIDRFECREIIAKDLADAGLLEKQENYQNKVGRSERTGAVIEPKLSAQWFISMEQISKQALDEVMNDNIQFHPPKFKNLYNHWMSNIKDWCISRQLWWGHQIPVYYLADGTFIAAESEDEALALLKEKSGNSAITLEDLTQDNDVLDTWASSWLWPLSAFDGISSPENKEIQYYYPTSDLVTGHDIIFFWVARMIIAGYHFREQKPFNNVYFTGMVRDKQGRKMSKQLGNSPDPIDLINKYGADGVRVGMLLCSPAGGDLLFDESLTEQGSGFTKKLWNAFRLMKSFTLSEGIPQPQASAEALKWFECRLNKGVQEINQHFEKFRLSDALMASYTLFRDDFSGTLLEIIKPAYQQPLDSKTYAQLEAILGKLLQVLHPFMPFITEEIWQQMKDRPSDESIMISQLPSPQPYNNKTIEEFARALEVVSSIRTIRKEKGIKSYEPLALQIKGEADHIPFESVVRKLGAIDQVSPQKELSATASSFMVGTTTFGISLDQFIDTEKELAKLKEELKYLMGFAESVKKKLSNERFVNNAPDKVVAVERKKLADSLAKITSIEESIQRMS